MTDTPEETQADAPDASNAADPVDDANESPSVSVDRDGGPAHGAIGDGRSLTELVQLGLLAILLLVIAIATFQFYFAAGAAVDRFVTRQYRPLFQAGFNLAIVLAAGAGLSVLVRRLA